MRETWKIFVYNQSTVVRATAHELEYHGSWMEDEYVMVSVKSPTPIEFHYGDHLYYRGVRYEINYDPNFIKKARSGSYADGFSYDGIKLYPVSARLKDIAFKDVVLYDMSADANKIPYSMLGTFSFFAGSVEDLADRILANLKREYGTEWNIFTPNRSRSDQRNQGQDHPYGTWSTYYTGSESQGKTEMNIDCQNLSCMDALKLAYTKFDLTFYIRGKLVVIGGKPITAGYDFEYGKGNGLYEIERTHDDSQRIVTKLYAYGSDKNLPLNYYANLGKKIRIQIYWKSSREILIGTPQLLLWVDHTWTQAFAKNFAPNYEVKLTCNGHTAYFGVSGDNTNGYDEDTGPLEEGRQYMYFWSLSNNTQSLAFYESVAAGDYVFVTGVNINAMPNEFIYIPSTYNYDAALSIYKLMLPGFPLKSLFSWVVENGGTHVDMSHLPKYGKVTWKGYTAYFSNDKNDPWIMSVNADEIGLREGTVEFDSSTDNEIYPTIEGTGFDEVNWCEQIEDNGHIDTEQTFKFMPQQTNGDGGIEWAYGGETVSISMKDGYCVGREFEVDKAEINDTTNLWELTLKRKKDDSLGVYFPYKYGNDSNLYQIMGRGNHQGQQEGDHFVVLGIPLPTRYVDAAAEKLLEEALKHLAKVDHQQYTYIPRIDEIEMQRQDDRAKASQGHLQSVHDTICAGMQMQLDDDDLNVHYCPFIDNITIKENGNNGIPTYDVVLRDEKEMTLQETIQSQIMGGSAALINAASAAGLTEADLESLGSKYFLSKLYDDVAKGLITFLKGAKFGNYVEGERGAYINNVGEAEVEKVWARDKAVLGKYGQDGGYSKTNLEVEGSSSFKGHLSSPDFISGFPGGTGWALQKKEYVNAAGETEFKYVLECDGANIRGTLRVYEFIISQLLGENDNRIFTAMLEVHHYDPVTGKVWLSTNGGKLYMPFRRNDCIMVQQYQPGNTGAEGGTGYITKQYELLITEVGSGGQTDENGDRLDWVTFTNFTTIMEGETAETLITKNDTFCRLDNLSDPERKGIIQIMTVGTNMPYMDIHYGMKTDPDNHLKGRIGNLEGIYDNHFGGWLQGFGEYLINSYLVGDMRLRRTGESVDTAIDIMNGMLASKMSETVYDLTGDDNFLVNSEFTDLDSYGNLVGWTIIADGNSFYSADGEMLIASTGTLADIRNLVRTEAMEGKQVLHISNGTIKQSRNIMRTPSKHKVYDEGTGSEPVTTYHEAWDELYLGLRIKVVKAGTLTMGFPTSTMSETGAMKGRTRYLEKDNDWHSIQEIGTWDGNSDFSLTFDGECYISLLSLTDKPLENAKTEYSTNITQTSRSITLQASKISSNGQSIAQLEVTAEQISSTVSSNYTDLDGRVTANASSIVQTASQIRSDVTSAVNTLDGKIATNASNITQTASAIRLEVSSAVSTLNGDISDTRSSITQTASDIRLEVSNAINGEVSARNSAISQSATNINASVTEKINAVNGRIDTANTNITSLQSQLDLTSSSISARVDALTDKTRDLMDFNDWESGTYSGTTKVADSTKMRTKTPIPINGSIAFTISNSYIIQVVFLSPSKSHISTTSFKGQTYGKVKFDVPSGASYINCVVMKGSFQAMGYIYDEVRAAKVMLIDTTIATSGEMSVFIDNFGESNAQIKADKIDFTFTKYTQWSWKSGSTTTPVMWLDTSGNLTITGTLTQGAIATGVTTDGIAVGSFALDYKSQYQTLPTGTSDVYTDIVWNNGGTTFLAGSHTSGWVWIRMPKRSDICTRLGIADGSNFVVELNIINLSSYNYVGLKFSSTTGVNTDYPRMMNYNNGSEANHVIPMGVGDYTKLLLVYCNQGGSKYYNAYCIINRADGWGH